jgi:anti-sigma factor RsiW
MTQIFNFQDPRHRQAQSLLPWYVNGTLDADEVVTFEKHLAECAECRADLEKERLLGHEIAHRPLDADHGWERMRAQLEARSSQGRLVSLRASRAFLRKPVPMGWVLAAQAACLALVVGAAWLVAPRFQGHTYVALGAVGAPVGGNVVVMFTPTAPEQALRGALRDAGARLVDGPTASDAYILHVDPVRRTDALSRLRANQDVSLAEPLDGEPRP